MIGGVTGAGAVAGAMIGGGVGAAVGAGIGAGVSTVIWLKQDRQATLQKDAPLVFSLTTPMILTPLAWELRWVGWVLRWRGSVRFKFAVVVHGPELFCSGLFFVQQ